MCDVIKNKYRIRVVTVQRYAMFINFQAGVHNIILELKEDPTKKAHPTGFMIKNADVDTIIHDWPLEWCDPIEEKMIMVVIETLVRAMEKKHP